MSYSVLPLFRERKGSFLLATILLFLHGSIWLDFASATSKSLLLIHLGLFLIWQPIWKSDANIDWQKSFVFISITLALVFWLNLWLMFIWLVILGGFFGGRTLINRSERYISLIVLVFILLQILFGCTIHFSAQTLGIFKLLEYLLILFPFSLLFFRSDKLAPSIKQIDFIHGISTALLFSLLSLGSLLNMYINNTPYVVSIIQIMFLIAGAALFIVWLSSEKSGNNTLSNLWVDSLLNIGTPFELWISRLADLMDELYHADDFINQAMVELNKYDWIAGLEWETKNIINTQGKVTEHVNKIQGKTLKVKIFTYRRIGSTLKLHCKLLIQILENFYLSKKREQELANQSRVMAIHDTGARITHDIKNILQSLNVITSEPEGKNDLAIKQLPQLSQRLQIAIDKLQSVDTLNVSMINIEKWWKSTKQFHINEKITFTSTICMNDIEIPEELFNTVIDNVLENFFRKSINEKNIQATVSLVVAQENLSLSISDTGSVIEENIVRSLFSESIDSKNGLGIGLHQSAKLAKNLGYELKLSSNENGNVCFELSKN